MSTDKHWLLLRLHINLMKDFKHNIIPIVLAVDKCINKKFQQ